MNPENSFLKFQNSQKLQKDVTFRISFINNLKWAMKNLESKWDCTELRLLTTETFVNPSISKNLEIDHSIRNTKV